MIYDIFHSYKPRIVVPYAGIRHNISFFADKDRQVRLSDGNVYDVRKAVEVHLCDIENEILRIYGCDAWTWVKKWYSSKPFMESLTVWMIDLEDL